MWDRGVSLIFINTLNDLATVWSTLSAWPDTAGWDWRLSRRTPARWVVGALSGWIGHRWADSKCSCDFVNNRMRRLRAPSATHSWVHSGLITKANERRTRGEDESERKGEPLLHHLTGHLSSIAPLNEPRPWVNMPLGCQSIPVTCNTNTQNLLSYKINVLLVPPCIALAQSYWSALKSSAAHVWQIMAKWSDSSAFSTYQVCRLCFFEAIAWCLLSKYRKCWNAEMLKSWSKIAPVWNRHFGVVDKTWALNGWH